MLQTKTPWHEIRTEYVTTDITHRELAEKYRLHQSTVSNRARKEKWAEEREKYRQKTQSKVVAQRSSRQAAREAKLTTLADTLVDRLQIMVEQGSETLLTPKDLKHIASVLKDIKDVLGIKSDADRREQEARIEKLRRDTSEQQIQPTIVVQGLPEEYKA